MPKTKVEELPPKPKPPEKSGLDKAIEAAQKARENFDVAARALEDAKREEQLALAAASKR